MFCLFWGCKKPYRLNLVRGMREGSRVGRKLPSVCRERVRHKTQPQGDAEESLKSLWAPKAPSHAWRVSLAKRYSPSPTWGPGQAAEVSQMVAHLLHEFHLLI